MCNLAKSRANSIRSTAIALLEAGITQKNVARDLRKSIKTVNNSWRRNKRGESLDDKPRSGRPSSLTRVAKIVIAKSVGKRHQSIRKLAKRLTASGHQTSKTAVHRYLRENLGLKSYKRPRKPKLTEKQLVHRLQFCKERLNWSSKDWANVIFSDEAPFHLFEPSNPQTDRVWDSSAQNIPPIQTLKFPPTLMVWAAMSANAVSELHILPQKCTINAKYYVDSILAGPCKAALTRRRSRGTIFQRKLCQNMSKSIFQQDGAPAHTSKLSQEWCRLNLPGYWAKGVWPGNSPDLSPIENLWAIVKQNLTEMPLATNLEMLEKNLNNVWSDINLDLLRRLIDGMPARIRKCVDLKGGYIGK